MNKAILMGRLTRDPELRTTSNDNKVCNFTLAVDRRFKNAQGERETDFINVVAWRQQAEFASRYFNKGARMLVVGSIQVRSWEEESGNRRYMTEVIADEIYFTESKRDSAGGGGYQANTGGRAYQAESTQEDDGFLPKAGADEGLPFDL